MIVFWLLLIFLIPLFIVRFIVTVRLRDKVVYAIFLYNYNLIRFHNEEYEHSRIRYEEVIEPFLLTYLNFFDLGYDQVVNNETYQKIKKYIE